MAAAVCSHFLPGNPGHVIVVPVHHYENLYAMPVSGLHACIDVAQAVALAMKVRYGAAGITLRQNNEPAGSQTDECAGWARRLTAGGQLISASASGGDA